jgi:glycine/D-amino acid oxidase-like deaminating enzyme
MKSQYDVIVVGGGTAGVVAAIQAGRAGARTLLVEKNGMLGGTVTVGGINAPSFFFAWGRPVIAGIGWELVRRTLEETGNPVPSPEASRDNATPSAVKVDIPVFAALCDEAVLQAGVELLFHAMPGSASFTKNDWTLGICTKSGLKETRAKVVVDTTGDANVVALAGLEMVHPGEVQPATLTMSCSGYDAEELDYPALKRAAEKAIVDGELKTTDISWRDNGPEEFLRRYGRNANHIRAHGAETSEGKSAAEVEARQAVLRMYRFFRKQPGLKNFRIDTLCSEAGIRETVTIKGKKTVCVKEYEAGEVYDDALCYAFYPVDEHLNDGRGVNWRPLKRNVLPTIPRAALLPAGSQFLIVAGRTVSSDREANSGLRVECPCMAMGQAAGAMAALSAKTGLDPEKLPLKDIRALLRKHGAVVPG